MSEKFFALLYEEVKKLFPEDAVETLIRPDPGELGVAFSAVKLIHKPTGHSVICEAFPTQKENYIYGLLRLKIICDEELRKK